jgi:hypothetical protein
MPFAWHLGGSTLTQVFQPDQEVGKTYMTVVPRHNTQLLSLDLLVDV